MGLSNVGIMCLQSGQIKTGMQGKRDLRALRKVKIDRRRNARLTSRSRCRIASLTRRNLNTLENHARRLWIPRAHAPGFMPSCQQSTATMMSDGVGYFLRTPLVALRLNLPSEGQVGHSSRICLIAVVINSPPEAQLQKRHTLVCHRAALYTSEWHSFRTQLSQTHDLLPAKQAIQKMLPRIRKVWILLDQSKR